MRYQEFSNTIIAKKTSSAGTGLLRVVLLFGSVAVALGLVLIPSIAEHKDTIFAQSTFQNKIDYNTKTGSIYKSTYTESYKK
ncbi:hypothetical protein [Bartonella tamiae]|uniref:Uncharacterized protein n=1 Tax=Bartonella tamiae Th239 TaxID=1094558 RepID=J0QWS7_9HYPH|nr:hypothetical protein [Bartonella tamiae]EJF90466.1 hypothetical protein ME5_00867 [Bartonella tamiae Th239]EJF93590.1 hypothetical protein MEG_01014 [Bartonella tamiae Th307]